jgi:hypothetical protein
VRLRRVRAACHASRSRSRIRGGFGSRGSIQSGGVALPHVLYPYLARVGVPYYVHIVHAHV